MNNQVLKFVIPTVDLIDNSYKYGKFKITNIPNKGLGIVTVKDLDINDLNSILIFGGILFNKKQYKKYIKLEDDLKFSNNSCNSNISHITLASVDLPEQYLIANPLLYKDKNNIKNGWIGSFVNEISDGCNETYNSELIVLSKEDIINCQSQIDLLPNCIDKRCIVGICIKNIVKKDIEITAYYGGEETFNRVNYVAKKPQIIYEEDGSFRIQDNYNILTPKKKNS